MKTSNFKAFVLVMAMVAVLGSCDTNQEPAPQQDLLPERFGIDIPDAISQTAPGNGRTQGDSLRGDDIYINMATFIAVGDASSELVGDIIQGIRKYKIDRVLTMSFRSDDDNRTKNLDVQANVAFESKTWQYMLTITDADSEGLADGGKAIQIFWDHSTPIKGIAIIKPYNCDRTKNSGAPDALFRIDYEEQPSSGYDAQMEVRISGLPVGSPLFNPYAINTLHMFAGKKGDVVDVYGNSNHPNAVFFSGQRGFNWAFVAAGNDATNIGVAELGLPPSDLDKSDRATLLKEHSIKNVLTNEIHAAWPWLDPNAVALYLKNAVAPGYFDKNGFAAAGKSPGAGWDALTPRLEGLTPYNPKATSELVVTFK